ncbi:MAG: hypothetical protein IPM98_10620 [Lewinellaceae bacterium]|nr:hypothetical protein [Lewinellaceae bacterium]
MAFLAALVFFLVLYLGFKTTSPSQKVVERSRSIQGESMRFETLLDDAKAHLSANDAASLADLEKQVDQAGSEADRVETLKKVSGWWYSQGQAIVSGGVAEQVAELEGTDGAWSVAGATFYGALADERDQKLRDFCASRAIKAFESAISLNPSQVEHRVNLALVYAENPPADNPMKAVLLLRELEGKYPDNPAVYNALGRLAIKTNQWERAIDRLEKSWSLDSKNPNTPCLLAMAYEGAGKTDKAIEFAGLCGQK